jgi:hypothetical protein
MDTSAWCKRESVIVCQQMRKGCPIMKTGFATTAAIMSALVLCGPALAGDGRWDRGSDHREWREDRNDRRERANAYSHGYRDGIRAENRRDRQYRQNGQYGQYRGPGSWQPYSNGSRWDQGYRHDVYPTYRGASVRGSQPYWWGSNGQVYCRRQDGTAGLVVGALAGGTLGNMIAKQGDKTLGSVIGGTLGAVLGNEIAKGNARCR